MRSPSAQLVPPAPPRLLRPEPARHVPFLDALPEETVAVLRPHLVRVPLVHHQVLLWQDTPIDHVYFPLRGVVSLLALTEEGAAVEAGLVGREGVVGLPVFLGAEGGPGRSVVQVPGEAWRAPARPFLTAATRPGPLQDRLLRYTQAVFVQVAQASACNRAHAIEERCARWLLMVHDRVDGDRLPLTQEYLSQMLGVRRPSVTVVMGALQRAGLVAYARGRVDVLDRPGLEAAACECYARIQREFDRLLGGARAAPAAPIGAG